MPRLPLALAAIAFVGIAAPLPASAAALADATYRCEMYVGSTVMHLGDIEISGSSYQGPASDGKYEGTYEYELSEAGTITWGGPMGGFNSGGNVIVSTIVRDGGFNIMMQVESGNFMTIGCSS